MDPLVLARYPFLPEAMAFVGAEGPSLEELLREPTWGRARALGRARLLKAVDEGVAAPSDAIDRSEALLDVLAYGVARMIASAAKDEYVVRRHAVAESKRMSGTLAAEEPEVLREVAGALGLPTERAGESRFALHFTDYLPYASALKDLRWKLVAQDLKGGQVTVDAHGLARLAEEAYRRRIEAELPRPVDDDVVQPLRPDVQAVLAVALEKKARFQMPEAGPLDMEAFPPCMTRILGMLQAGENAPHAARFAVTSFLHTLGLTADEIIALFAKAPDFREDLTRYQVEHITGVSGGTAYTPPGCQAMKTYGICYGEDDWCRRTDAEGARYVAHPLSYYRWAVKRKNRGRHGDGNVRHGDGGSNLSGTGTPPGSAH